MARHLPGKDTDRENGRPNGAQDALGAVHCLRRRYLPGRVDPRRLAGVGEPHAAACVVHRRGRRVRTWCRDEPVRRAGHGESRLGCVVDRDSLLPGHERHARSRRHGGSRQPGVQEEAHSYARRSRRRYRYPPGEPFGNDRHRSTGGKFRVHRRRRCSGSGQGRRRSAPGVGNLPVGVTHLVGFGERRSEERLVRLGWSSLSLRDHRDPADVESEPHPPERCQLPAPARGVPVRNFRGQQLVAGCGPSGAGARRPNVRAIGHRGRSTQSL